MPRPRDHDFRALTDQLCDFGGFLRRKVSAHTGAFVRENRLSQEAGDGLLAAKPPISSA